MVRDASVALTTSPPGGRLLSVFDRVIERRWRFSMDVGIGLPNAVPDTEGRTLVDWARRADEAGFSTLGTIGRLVYPNYEELIALAAAAITVGVSLPVKRSATRNPDTIAGVQAPAKIASNTRRTVFGESPLGAVISAKTSANLGASPLTATPTNSRLSADHGRSRSTPDETVRPRPPAFGAGAP